MIFIRSDNILSAVKQAYLILYEQTQVPFDQNLAKEDSATIVISNNNDQKPLLGLKDGKLKYLFDYKSYFPYVNKELIDFELGFWQADFIKPPRLKNLVQHLRKYPTSRRAIINLWRDGKRKQLHLPAPCVTHIFFRRKDPYLETHAHLRANNVIFLLMMDMQVLSGIQQIAADMLGLKKGIYIHFVDSLHYYKKEEEAFQRQYKYILNSEIWQKI